jgi:histone acetyltransferase (RNA polymerase elongator complex component)
MENEPTLTENEVTIEDIIKPYWVNDITQIEIEKCLEFLKLYYLTDKDKSTIKNDFVKYHFSTKTRALKFGYLIYLYQLGRQDKRFPEPDYELETQLKVTNVRENSGVMVFSIFTSAHPSYTKVNPDGTTEIVREFDYNPANPGAFSCKYDCAYCPNEPGQPRSYLAGEPGVDRAIQNSYDVKKQIVARASQYIQQGHPVDKCEIIIQGGTWDSYSYEYREEFIRDVYYTFNVLMDIIFQKPIREKLSMKQEIKINETAPCRIVGLTPETRPDQINYQSIKFLRKIGATRVQLGIQHIDDEILRYINRGCYHKDTVRAIKMLKDSGFKVDGHIMPDLPAPPGYDGIMHEVDREMFLALNTDPNIKLDQLKIYPCVVTPHTKIKEWYEQGIYKPYGEERKLNETERIAYRKLSAESKLSIRLENPLYKNIMDFYSSIHPSIRVNRIIRDIPTNIICGGTTRSGMRGDIDHDMETLGMISSCIRYREAGNSRNSKRTITSTLEPVMKEIIFESSEGTEYFITFESTDENPILYAFARVRLSQNSGKTNAGKVIFPELVDCAIVRELHTYGKVTPCKDNLKYYTDDSVFMHQDNINKSQHKGYGKRLLERAEQIAKANGYNKIAVIAGVGVREYYRKLGYNTDSELGCYQLKNLDGLTQGQVQGQTNGLVQGQANGLVQGLANEQTTELVDIVDLDISFYNFCKQSLILLLFVNLISLIYSIFFK